MSVKTILPVMVALRKESVDRNNLNNSQTGIGFLSLSARRAWIEITALDAFLTAPAVALRKESVDRNFFVRVGVGNTHGRSPQGERG